MDWASPVAAALVAEVKARTRGVAVAVLFEPIAHAVLEGLDRGPARRSTRHDTRTETVGWLPLGIDEFVTTLEAPTARVELVLERTWNGHMGSFEERVRLKAWSAGATLGLVSVDCDVSPPLLVVLPEREAHERWPQVVACVLGGLRLPE